MLIAQITDLHVTRGAELLAGRVDTHAAFSRCLERLASLDPRPDLLLVTGDLTETATDGEYAYLKAGLDRLGLPYLVVPGNHDDRAAMRRAFPDMLPAAAADAPFCHATTRDDWPLRLIGIDSIVPRRSEGALDAARLAWLETEVAKASPEQPALLFMHHPPFRTGIAPMDACGVLEGLEAFRALITRHAPRIAGILCGHVHRVIHASIAGVPVLLAPSSAHQIELDLRENAPLGFCFEPSKIALHDWRPDQGLVSNYVYVERFPGPYPFG
ncbi:phosphodiesterase [Ferrovibrio sp.]|uniref:phosphodiesterase n=1 Tax=Ferrovibrio sp. TaxID=1917215 RepID=UPI003D2E4916